MTKSPRPPGTPRSDTSRSERLKSALKANLARRKAQTRARQADAGGGTAERPGADKKD